jgi:hypothetical protein
MVGEVASDFDTENPVGWSKVCHQVDFVDI